MIRFIFLSILFRATIGQSFHCRFIQHAYDKAVQESEFLGANDSDLKRVRRDDIGNNYFAQQPTPPEADVDFNRTTTLLMAGQFLSSIGGRNTLNQFASCIPLDKRCSTMPMEKPPKDPRFRTITGAWNNLKNPKWGKSYTPYGHLLTTNFADGISEIRKSVVGQSDLPGARVATNAIKKDPFTCNPEFPANLLSVMFGQLMAHDHGMRQMYQSKEGGSTRTCCNDDYSEPLSPQPFGCHAIEYPENDPFLSEASPNCKIRCMNYIRSQATFPNDCKVGSFQAVTCTSSNSASSDRCQIEYFLKWQSLDDILMLEVRCTKQKWNVDSFLDRGS